MRMRRRQAERIYDAENAQTLAFRPIGGQLVLWTPVGRRERNLPKIRRGRIEFNGDVIAFRHFPRGASYFTRHFFLRLAMLQHEPRIHRQIPLDDHDRAVMIHAQRGHFVGGFLALDTRRGYWREPEASRAGFAAVPQQESKNGRVWQRDRAPLPAGKQPSLKPRLLPEDQKDEPP